MNFIFALLSIGKRLASTIGTHATDTLSSIAESRFHATAAILTIPSPDQIHAFFPRNLAPERDSGS
jgi:hypothetical protein